MFCMGEKKKDTVEYSRIVLQCSQSAVTLENKIKCHYHLHYSKLLARNQWLSMKVIFGSQLLFCLFGLVLVFVLSLFFFFSDFFVIGNSLGKM